MASKVTGAETEWWISDDPSDYATAELRGVVVGADGVIEIGPRAISVAADSLTTIWALAVLGDGSVALAGDGGRIERWSERGGMRPWAKLPVGQVLSLAVDGDGVVAGTGPEGLVYRIGARGDTALLARTGERYVWGLAPAGASAWYAATGTTGKLLRIEPGRVRVVLDSDESNLVALLGDGAGGAYVGGDSRGLVIHVRRDGSARTLFEAPEQEVRALALGADRALYAAALSASAVQTPAPTPASPEGEEESKPEPPEPQPTPSRSPVAGGKATVYRILPDSATATFWKSPQPFLFALVGTPGGVVAATGNRAGLYLLERAGAGSQWLAASQGQMTALALGARGRVFAAGSNPGALWAVGPEPGARGEILSAIHDAKRTARLGRIRWHGEGGGSRIEVYARSGNTAKPDTGWSPWRGGTSGREGSRIDVPPARYFQWKLVLTGGTPRLESVEAAWREQNLPPTIDEVIVAPQGQGFRQGQLVPRGEPVTQTLSGGRKVEYSPPAAETPRALRDLPMWARGLRTVQWKASDPNGDALRYRAEVRTEGGEEWRMIGEDLESTSFTWDTAALPDGRYRLRVTATDQAANPIGEEGSAEAVSEPFTVDNTPPTVTALEARGEPGAIRVRARAEDELGPLSRLEVALDEGDWHTVSPVGGLADDRALAMEVVLNSVEPGRHTVSVRSVDLAGNTASRSTHVTVPAKP